VHAFDVLGDPVRRRILELLATGEHTAGNIVEVIQKEFGLSQAGVSQHLKVLLQEVNSWLDQLRGFWEKGLSALSAEIARGKRERRGLAISLSDPVTSFVEYLRVRLPPCALTS